MLRPVVQHVAALAPGREVGRAVVGRVVISVAGCQDNPRRPHLAEHVGCADLDAGKHAGTIAPGRRLIVPPPPIAETEHG